MLCAVAGMFLCCLQRKPPGTQFTCFTITSTKVQILTPEELQDFLGLTISSVSQLDYETLQEVADGSRVLSTCGFAWDDVEAGGGRAG